MCNNLYVQVLVQLSNKPQIRHKNMKTNWQNNLSDAMQQYWKGVAYNYAYNVTTSIHRAVFKHE